MAHRYFLTAVDGDKAFVTGDEAAHLAKVMRLKPGDCVTLTDGAGFDYKCTAKEITPQEVIFHIQEKFSNPAEPKKQLTVFMALPKSDKLEFICQKSCELGAVNFVPFVSEFCVAQKSKKDDAKTRRLQKISDEACKQCGRSKPMAVAPTATFKQILPMLKGFDKVILFYEQGAKPLNSVDFTNREKVAVIIGSEGGFSQREADEMSAAGRENILLGSRILRCETAAVAGTALVMYRLGEMN